MTSLLRVLPALLVLCFVLSACADPYLAANVKCVEAYDTRAEIDACRAKLRDAAAPSATSSSSPSSSGKVDGGAHG